MNLAGIHVRDIQPDGNDGVRLVVQRVTEQEVSGRVDDGEIRSLLLSAVRDPSDPSIRVYSLEVLKGQQGGDVRDALLKSARSDSNAAVRLKALEGLRQFPQDSSTLETLKYVLEHDDNPGVRSEAIDMLAPAGQTLQATPDLAGTLEEILRSERDDDYVRSRCVQVLREMNAPISVY
jgi:HEAT repeat protein